MSGTDYSKLSTEQLRSIALGGGGGGTPEFEREAAAIRDAPSPLERVGAGVADITQGAKQKFLNWTDPAAAADYTAQINAEREQFRGAQRAAGDTGFDWWRLGGTVGMMSPMALLPGGQGAMARGVMGAIQGGVPSYLSYSERNNPISNLMTTGAGALIGAGANVALSPLIDATARGAQWLGNKAGDLYRGAVQAVTPQVQVTNNVRAVLRTQGIDFDALSSAAQRSIIDDAAAQMRQGGTLDAAALARKLDIEAIAGRGAGTTAQVTRDPAQWSVERNLQRTEANLPAVRTGGQETLTSRYQAQDAAMKGYAERTGAGMYGERLYGGAPEGGPAQTGLQASQRAIDAVRAADAKTEQSVRKLYEAYRLSGAKDARVPEEKLTSSLTKILDEIGQENIPPAVQARLKEFGFLGGERTRYLTVQQADLFNRLLNANTPQAGGGVAAVGMLKRALNESLLDVPVGETAGTQALLVARKAAADRFAAQRAGRGVEQAIENVAPDRFLQNNVLGGSVRDLQELKNALAKSPDSAAWNDLRAQAWQAIHEKSTMGGRAPFSGATLDDTLRKIGKERLEVLFTKPELDAINTLRRGSLAMTYQPPFSAVNTSNTAPALLGQALRLGNRIPGANMLTQPILQEVENTAAQGLLTQALAGRASSTAGRDAAQSAARQALLESLKRSGAPALLPLSAPAVAAQYR